MPPKCIELLGKFLKQDRADCVKDRLGQGDARAISKHLAISSRRSPTRSTKRRPTAGCNKYNLNGSDEKQFEQMSGLAAAEAPGTLGFIKFLGALSSAATDNAGDVPTDCAAPLRRSSRSWSTAAR